MATGSCTMTSCGESDSPTGDSTVKEEIDSDSDRDYQSESLRNHFADDNHGDDNDDDDDDAMGFVEPPAKVRKRMRRPQTRRRQMRKTDRQAETEYRTEKGKEVQSKEVNLRNCGCRLRCGDAIPEDRKKQIFKHYYQLNWSMKTAFIAGQVEIIDVKRRYTEGQGSRRSKTRYYRLQDSDGTDHQVCKTFFKDAIGVSDGRITLALARKKDNGTSYEDKRGKHRPHNKTSSDDENFAQEFIDLFPASHYCRKDGIRSANLNVSVMYEQYENHCSDNEKVPVSLFVFRKFFNENMLTL